MPDLECISTCGDCILRSVRHPGPLYISALLALLLVICHIIFSLKNIVSLNTSMYDKKNLKIVVFDLDETLGCFIELGIFWESLEKYAGHNLLPDHFYEVMALFPEFLRPNILPILKYVQLKKDQGKCDKVMIYTNNQGPRSWTTMISEYLSRQLAATANEPAGKEPAGSLFDNIIAAFKVRGKVVEIGRTSHEKNVDDLVRCTRVPSNTEICFIDDQFHSLMDHENVYYINVKPFWYSLSFKAMADRYYELKAAELAAAGIEKADFVKKIAEYMSAYNFTVVEKSDAEKKVDEIVGAKIMSHLEEFFADRVPHNTSTAAAQTRRKKMKRAKNQRTMKRTRR